MHVVITAEAETDLEDIFDYIAQDSPRLAGEFVRKLREKALRIGTAPRSYPRRPAYGKGIRVAFLSAYVILFHILTDTVEVLHIVYGARDLNRLFAGD